MLPAEIIDDWGNRLHLAGCSPLQSVQVKLVIEHTLAYPSTVSVEACLGGFTAAFHHNTTAVPDQTAVFNALKQLENAGQLETSNRFAQSHPVAMAIKKIHQAASTLQIDPGPWLGWFLDLCGQAQNHPERLTPSSYYRHTVHARDVLIFVMRNQTAGALPAGESIAQACDGLHRWFERMKSPDGEPVPIPTSSVKNLDEKIDVVVRLIDHTWEFGVPSVVRSPRNTAGESDHEDLQTNRKSTASKPLPTILTPTPAELKRSKPRQKPPRNQSLAYTLGEGTETLGRPPAEPTRRDTALDPDAYVDGEEIESARMDAPPELLPSERRKKYGSLLHVQAAQNVCSRSDMQRYSRRQLSTWLQQFVEEDSLSAVFLLLVWGLGMAPERLAALHVSTNDPADDAAVVLNPNTHQLTYRIMHLGATAEPPSSPDSQELPSNHLMRLVLPAGLVARIVDADNHQPFIGMEQAYRESRQRIEKRTGSRPCTLKQWASSVPSLQAQQFNALETATLRGYMGFNEIASSAYRTHDLATLNTKFSECLSTLRDYWDAEGLMTGPGTESLADLTVTQRYPTGKLGSTRYAPPEALASVIYAIRNAIKQAHQRLKNPYKTKSLNDLVALVALQQLNYFLIVQLHTVGRALNNKTQIGYSTQGLWVSDKASHRYRERKVICAIPGDIEKNRGLMLEQREHSRQTLQHLIDLAGTLKLKFEMSDTATADLPFFVEFSPTKQRITVSRMTPARWWRAIETLGLSETWTTAGNVFRHLASTELSATMSDSVVDEVLGHKNPGRDWWGSESAGRITSLRVMVPVIESWAQRMGLRAVALDERAFGGFYDFS